MTDGSDTGEERGLPNFCGTCSRLRCLGEVVPSGRTASMTHGSDDGERGLSNFLLSETFPPDVCSCGPSLPLFLCAMNLITVSEPHSFLAADNEARAFARTPSPARNSGFTCPFGASSAMLSLGCGSEVGPVSVRASAVWKWT